MVIQLIMKVPVHLRNSLYISKYTLKKELLQVHRVYLRVTEGF